MKTATPEADAACGLPSHDWIKTAERLYECAKKLEAERDAARKAANELAAAIVAMLDGTSHSTFSGWENGNGEEVGKRIDLNLKKVHELTNP